jgi:hypothetical protein
MKKLYVVDVTHTVYVVAEDPQEADRTARRGIREYGDDPICSASEVKDGPIDPDWRDAVPYGGEDERTVSQILNAAKSDH